eukprot:TRINITY_DN9436_c0_g1_i5.p1 TRINITY_DN9436_c0_g1~~TRINITY_DN9436_c0_g1_i5.p1  ORF type:complete len:319 (+),score=109.96 TRINITY_DN9436_c0_g1_i5:459-1415(+)
MVLVANRYQIIQLGLCFFTSQSPDTYTAHPFNVYLFPEDRPGAAGDLSLSLDGMSFHRSQQVDFNKWIYQGVPYLNGRQEQILRSRIDEEFPREEQEVLSLTAEETKRTDVTLSGIKSWWQSGAREEYVIQNFNPYLRKYMYQQLGRLYPALNIECKSNGKYSKSLILTMLTAESQKCLKDAKTKKQLNVIQRKSGAQKVFKLLTRLRPVIVGHGVVSDLLFLYSSFQEDLPPSLHLFKEKLHCLFPAIYDTMTISADLNLKELLNAGRSLKSVYKLLSREGRMEGTRVDLGEQGKHWSKECYHEAGYDSYVTGSSWC